MTDQILNETEQNDLFESLLSTLITNNDNINTDSIDPQSALILTAWVNNEIPTISKPLALFDKINRNSIIWQTINLIDHNSSVIVETDDIDSTVICSACGHFNKDTALLNGCQHVLHNHIRSMRR